ncbi:MAG: crossover junction endodeoxyribonuclease RuvC [Sinobacteraceae bacterium]|nr:crossover junction endodeoxyribonuclease RuvC [Nevskiaceae bacterium]
MSADIRILGIDPGSRSTGYGVIELDGQRSHCLAHGCIRCEGANLPERLLKILRDLEAVIREFSPSEAAVEQVFVRRNVASSLILGQARGAAICALAAAELPLAEYAPAQIKSALVGHGRAEKPQIQHMVKVLLSLRTAPSADAADALAVALCHAHLRRAPQRPGARRTARSSWRQFVPQAVPRSAKP